MSDNTLQLFAEIEELLARKSAEWKEFKRLEKDDKVVKSPISSFFLILITIFNYLFYIVFFLSFIPLIILAFKYISEELLNSGEIITIFRFEYKNLYFSSAAGILINVLIIASKWNVEYLLFLMVPWLPKNKEEIKMNKIFKAIAAKRYNQAKDKLIELGFPKKYQHKSIIKIMKEYEVDNLSAAINKFDREWKNTDKFEQLQKMENDDLMEEKLIELSHLLD